MDLLLIAGIILIIGMLGSRLSNKIKFPGVVGYIFAGILLGPSVAGVLSHDFLNTASIISDFALGFIAFMIGNELRWDIIKKTGRSVIIITVVQAVVTFIMVGAGVFVLTRNTPLSLIFGALGVATDPAVTYLVLREYKAKGELTNTLLAVVGIDDAIAIIIYSFAMSMAKLSMHIEANLSVKDIYLMPLVEIAGAIIVGVILGIIVVNISRRNHDVNENLTISLAAIFICSGLSGLLGFSLILSNLVLGIIITNMSSLTGKRISNSIQGIAHPVFLMFFVLAGAHLNIGMLPMMGMLGLVYIIVRIIGKVWGSYAGAVMGKAEPKIKKYLGYGLLSQAGVAIGLAMLVGREFGMYSDIAITVISVITASTIIFEIMGAFGVKYAVTKAGEIEKTDK